MTELIPAGEGAAPIRELVQRLADARLVVTRGLDSGAEGEVEVAHEALIRHWPRLRGWLDEDRINYRLREGIGEDAAEWDRASRPDDLLPRWNSKLAAAAELSSRRPRFFNELERAYLDVCVRLRDREAAEREQRAKELEKALADARRQARVAACGQLAAQSQAALSEGKPQRGVLLAVEALKIEPDSGVSHVPAAEQAFRDALGLIGGCGLGGHEGMINALAFSPDGRWLATGQ